MRLYVEYRFVVPVEVDDDMYECNDPDEFIAAAQADTDFYEVLPAEPVPFVEADYEVLDSDAARWHQFDDVQAAFRTDRYPSASSTEADA